MINGAISRKLDVRDVKLGAVQAPVLVPQKFLPDLTIYPKYFQNQTPSCGAHAGTALKTVQETNELGTPVKLSPRYLWTKIKLVDGYSYTQGTDMRSIFKRLQDSGVCSYELGGNNVNLTLKDYANMPITEDMDNDAQPRVISSYAFLPNGFSIDDLKQAIYQNKAVLILIRCDNGFFGSDNPTFTSEIYGHYVVACGYDENGFYCIDSTETEHQVKFIDSKYFSFIKEAGTAVDCDNQVIKDLVDKKRLLQQLVVLWQQLVNLYSWIKTKGK